MKRILVVEDEADIALSLRYNLEREGGYAVTVAADGERALREAEKSPPDAVLLDLNLPGMDGLEVCRQLRRRAATARVPILMVTARVGEGERVTGLDEGADDYVTKPFSIKEVLARLRAVLRRTSGDDGEVLEDAGLRLDLASREVHVEGAPVVLTRKEFDLLADLLRHRGRVLTRERLLERVWGYDYPGETRTVDVHVRRLRQKLGAPVEARIETVVGVGYRYRASA
ncbi:MAG TPA: response regulator transcription factor [Candidatus Polarisedimenticolaceae bacterium]|nr:response regulator transcription factor [Candidatus Polarisedimenticolaceae bacterium]